MSKATISLTNAHTGGRCVIVWRNISCVGKSAPEYGATLQLAGGWAAYVKETVKQVEQAIEKAARDD